MPRHPLILDGSLTPLAGHQNCACTFYLVFKEPAFRRSPHRRPNRRQGNLTSITVPPLPVNNFFDASERCFNRGRTNRKGRALGDRTHKKFAPHTEPGANRPAHRAGARSVRQLYDPPRTVSTSGTPPELAATTPVPRSAVRSRRRRRGRAAWSRLRAHAPPPGRVWRVARPLVPCSA
jgi:hypothetical protein